MDRKQSIILVTISSVVVIASLAVVYFLFKTPEPTQNQIPATLESYPESVQTAVQKPVEKIGDWSVLDASDDYQISYSFSGNTDSFFITLNAEPLDKVLSKAEANFLNKLQIKQDQACSLPVIITVPNAVNANVVGLEFGFSFCPNVLHLKDVLSSIHKK